jgi:hypothetical protein
VIYRGFTPKKRRGADNGTMFSRRFVLLGAVLVSLNLVLWFASPGFALPRALFQQLFGPQMIRAEIVESKPVAGSTDWHIDRGVITQISSTQLTLRESDTKVLTIPLSPSTKVRTKLGASLPLSALAAHWHVVVTWPASGAAMRVDVERVPRGRVKNGLGQSAAPAPSLS